MAEIITEISEINIPANLTYQHFRELMNEADDMIGGGQSTVMNGSSDKQAWKAVSVFHVGRQF